MNIIDSLNDIGRKSLDASNQVKNFTSEEKNNLLIKIAEKINSDKELILNANQKDISIASETIDKAMLDRLALNSDRVDSIINSINDIVLLEDPINKELLIKRIDSINSTTEKEFYVLGDNKADSYDSRKFGYIKKELIIGKAVLRYWPLNKIRKL